jgi:hypothetical protein
MFRRSRFQISTRTPVILIEKLRGFPQSIQAVAKFVPHFRPWSFYSTVVYCYFVLLLMRTVGLEPRTFWILSQCGNCVLRSSVTLWFPLAFESKTCTMKRRVAKCLMTVIKLVLYGCETWALTLREEHRLRVFENRVLRRIFGPKREEVTGGWRKLHNEELHNLLLFFFFIWTMRL